MFKIRSKSIQPASFFVAKKGIKLFKLYNKNGIEVLVTNYGLRLVSLFTPDKNGDFDDIVLGYDTLVEFETKHPYMNSIIGRVANRIDEAQFILDGQTHQLNVNNVKHCLHGGEDGLHQQIWEVISFNNQTLHFYHFSKAGSQGFPGNLKIDVFITLTDTDELRLKYKVTTDQATPVNLTYHPYFNLTGTKNQSIVNHLLQINADRITTTDSSQVANGNFISIKNSPFDFNMGKAIGQDIQSDNLSIKNCGGYDHNFVLKNEGSPTPFLAAKLSEPISKRSIEIWTTQPGIQLYTSNHMDEFGKGNLRYRNHSAVCLEPQYFPNSPNMVHFPTIIVLPDEPYLEECIYKFGTI